MMSAVSVLPLLINKTSIASHFQVEFALHTEIKIDFKKVFLRVISYKQLTEVKIIQINLYKRPSLVILLWF